MGWFGRISGLDAALAILGILALLAISPVGHGVAIISLITVIGIPIYFLILVIPSAFLVLLFVRLVIGAWSNFRSGQANKAVIFLVCVAALTEIFVFRA